MESSPLTEYVAYPSIVGDVRGYLARPDAGPSSRPALIVVHEWTGLIPYVEDVCRRLAREGYVALAPDLYSGDLARAAMAVEDLDAATELGRAPTVEEGLREVPAERRKAVLRAHEWRQARTGDKYLLFLQGTLAYLRERRDANPSAIGAIGFCMGGRLASTLAATGAELAAAVSFYGPNPPLADVPNIRCPIQGHYGSEDPSVTLKVPALEAAMKAADKEFTQYVYEGAAHGFHNDTRPDYHPEAARVAWERALDFLQHHLQEAARR
ncbi:MAG TPA: dienelactone hydrolase family protein [Chloroflexota bacterium]